VGCLILRLGFSRAFLPLLWLQWLARPLLVFVDHLCQFCFWIFHLQGVFPRTPPCWNTIFPSSLSGRLLSYLLPPPDSSQRTLTHDYLHYLNNPFHRSPILYFSFFLLGSLWMTNRASGPYFFRCCGPKSFYDSVLLPTTTTDTSHMGFFENTQRFRVIPPRSLISLRLLPDCACPVRVQLAGDPCVYRLPTPR